MEGVLMGSSIAGPYGAGGGLVIGLLAGLFTADSYYGELNRQIVTEQQKDQQLEAAIEQELARQRELENKIANPGATSNTQPPAAGGAAAAGQTASAPAPNQAAENVNLASLSKPTALPTAPSPFKNVAVRDMNGDGVPDLWIYYNPSKPGEITRQEEASKGDGRVDTWSYFKDGKLTRRDVDSKGLGRPDTVFYYDQDQIVREERDEDGQGRMTYRASYQHGRIAKVEKDSSGTGRPDLWIYYDTSRDGEVVVKEERDLNGDGIVDLWSYYDNGRLARRDVSAVGLEILTKQEKLPVSASELKATNTPGS